SNNPCAAKINTAKQTIDTSFENKLFIDFRLSFIIMPPQISNKIQTFRYILKSMAIKFLLEQYTYQVPRHVSRQHVHHKHHESILSLRFVLDFLFLLLFLASLL